LVPTPIGNLEDITLRALRILREVDLIACEDTRQTAKLLNHFGIKNKSSSFYRPRELEQGRKILAGLGEGKRIALVSDAGSPGLSDPGEHLVHEAIQAGFLVEALPGATALIPALTTSGFPTSPFVFLGFAPRKRTDLKILLQAFRDFRGVLAFYESPRRIASLCQSLAVLMGDLSAVAVKEISKIHETHHRGLLSGIAQDLAAVEQKGEWVLMVHKTDVRDLDTALNLETIDDIYDHFHREHGIPKNLVRKIIQTRKK
jgi:16S rRNA (cytidine1402-2'-O)-methyltransferase